VSLSSNLSASAKYGAKLALYLSSSILAVSLVGWGVGHAFGDRYPFNWAFAIRSSVITGLALAVVLSVWSFVNLMLAQPALDILDAEAPESGLQRKALFGFVAMEYYWLILNRTYLVFIAPEGLYGWRAQGPRTNFNPSYFGPYQEMLEDNEFMRNRRAIEKLSQLRGGFFLQGSAIISVVADDQSKWGMGGIPHSGRIKVRLSSGKSREFILLGRVSPEGIRDRIVLAQGDPVASIR
jgi:hypothetical protein